jgi:hypothetical protein
LYKLFISHSTLDDAFVDLMVDKLKGAGFTTWIDHRDILYGEIWSQAIETALSEANAMILVLSEAAIKSYSVEAEWESYLGQKIIFPILLGISPARMPVRLRLIQAQVYDQKKARAWHDLINAIRATLEKKSDAIPPRPMVIESDEFQAYSPDHRVELQLPSPVVSEPISNAVQQYIDLLRPIPTENPRFWMASQFVTENLYSHFRGQPDD